MTQKKQPAQTARFWTPGMVALVGVNIAFLAIITAGVWVAARALWPVIEAWIKSQFGLG